MRRVFIDTMGWYSLCDCRDAWHADAVSELGCLRDSNSGLVTSDYVVDETATLLLARGASNSLAAFFDMLENTRALSVAMVGPSRFKDACQFFLKHRDQGYSFTDVTSFLVMRELRIREVFTHDEHFARAGFLRLLE